MSEQHQRVGGPLRRALHTALLACLVLAALAGLAPGASAGETESFRFQPHPLRVQGNERRAFQFGLAAGTNASDAVLLLNKAKEPRRFRVYAADAWTDPKSGAVTVASSENPAVGVGSWIVPARGEVALLPGTSEIIPFTVTRPADQTSEGLGAIVAEEVRDPGAGSGIDLVYRLAILVKMTGDPNGVRLTEPGLEMPVRFFPSTATAHAPVTNHTLAPVNASVRFEVQSLTGRRWPLEPVSVTLAPGETKDVSQVWSTVPRWGGILGVNADVTWEAGNVRVSGARRAYPALWLVALGILLLGVRIARELRTPPPRPGPPRRDKPAGQGTEQPAEVRPEELVLQR